MTEYINKQNLKDRGWTETGIKRFLGQHDAERRNPIYRTAAPQKLYEKERVLRLEASADFQSWLRASQKRKQSAAEAAETKREKLLCIVQDIAFEIPNLPIATLLRNACDHYNDRQRDIGSDWLANPKTSDSEFLARISYNYIRHVLSDYEWELEELHGQVGKDDAYAIIKDKVFEAIDTVYPDLEETIYVHQQGEG